MKKINRVLNFFINNILKWPMAILMILFLIPALYADLDVFKNLTDKDVLVQFFLPFTVTSILFLFMPMLAGSFFAIMEHELTHMLFAILTFHKPKGLDVKQDTGGYFSFEGNGNWLIALAPYFFPTFWFFVVIGVQTYISVTGQTPDFYLSLLGIFLGYNFIVTCLSIHPKQTDFKVAGYFFTVCFLPGITLLKYGIVFAYSVKGIKGIDYYFSFLYSYLEKFLSGLI